MEGKSGKRESEKRKHSTFNIQRPTNAAELFEKGKRQNRLADEHIEKIIETYQFRKEENRYSKRVPMERIAEEGYNLKISRYISTAIAESEINLAAKHNELVQIEDTIRLLLDIVLFAGVLLALKLIEHDIKKKTVASGNHEFYIVSRLLQYAGEV